MQRFVLSSSLLLFTSILSLTIATSNAGAAPTARFVATPLQGSVCVAPCAVHFDAVGANGSGTTDPAYARAFHTLVFEWDFGDAASGTWPTSGLSRNRAIGGIAGHLYERPGTYAVSLAVTNPAGQTHLATRQVVVTDPNTAFSSGNTLCIANSGTPGGAGFEACPVRAASQHRVIAATASGGFESGLSACGATSRKARCLFRAGDSFRSSRIVGLAGGSEPGLVSRFGAGANPRVTGGPGFLTMNTGWTVSGFQVELAGDQPLFNLPPGRGSITAANVVGTNLRTTCFVTQTGNSTAVHSDRIGAFGLECRNRGDSRLTGFFLRSERTLVYGNVIDGGYGGEFNLRTVHFPRSVIAHNVLMRPQEDANNRRNPLQLRSWAGNPNPAQALPRPSKTEYVIVSDNVLSHDNNEHFVRTCQTNDCGDAATSQSMENLIFERNFLYLSRGGTGGVNHVPRVFWLQGGDITIRNNVVDLQGVSTTTTYSGEQLVAHTPNNPSAPNLNDDRIHVLNNTVYHDERTGAAFQFCVGGRVGSAHLCRNNLAWLPNQTGTRRIDDGGAWSSANNLFAGPNPFAVVPPQQGAGSIASFQLGSSGVAIDGGYNYPAGDPSVKLDAGNRCRPADGPDVDTIAHWDAGAFEARAASGCRRLP